MGFKLVFQGGDRPQRSLDEGSCTIGSAPEADLRLEQDGIAPLHCELLVGAQGVRMRVGQGMRVLVNERPVEGLLALRGNDVLGLGDARIRLLDAGDQAASAGGDARAELGATMIRPVLPRFALRGLSGPLFGRSFAVNTELSVGRAEDAGLRIALDSVSRQHARLVPAGDEVLVEDLGSANGTWINGKRITRARAVHGDEIRFDKERFQLLAAGQPALARQQAAAARPRWPWLLVALVLSGALVAWLVL